MSVFGFKGNVIREYLGYNIVDILLKLLGIA
jgi:hypothetical protein